MWAAIAAIAGLLAALVALIVLADGPAQLVDEARDALWWLAAAIVAGALALWAWWIERKRPAQLVAELREREEELDQLRNRQGRVTRRDEAERTANREMRREIAKLQHERG